MQKVRSLLILGIWVSVLSFLGFPYSFKKILFVITGFILIYLSFVLYKDYKKENIEKEVFDSFSENSPLIEEIDIIETIEDTNNENFLEEDTDYNKDQKTKEQ